MAGGFSQVTDPAILAQLNAGNVAPSRGAPTITALPTNVNPNETPGAKIETARGQAIGTADVPSQTEYAKLMEMKGVLDLADRRLNQAQSYYSRSLKGMEPWRVAREYFPGLTPASKISSDVNRFNSAANQVYSSLAGYIRAQGEGSQSDVEFLQKKAAYMPSSSDLDATNEEKLSGLRDMINAKRAVLQSRLDVLNPKSKTPNIDKAKAQIMPKRTVLHYDSQGNRIK